MKIACLSDVHGNIPALRAAFSAMPDGIEAVLFLGDSCGYYPMVDECVELLRQSAAIGVRGNHDQILLDCLNIGMAPSLTYEAECGTALRRCIPTLSSLSRAWIAGLPTTRTLHLKGRTIALFHGAPWDPLEGRVYPDFQEWERFRRVEADIILLGQTHYPLQRRIDQKIIVNPGSVGQARDRAGAAAFALLDLENCSVDLLRVRYDPRELIADAQRHDPDVRYLVDVLVSR